MRVQIIPISITVTTRSTCHHSIVLPVRWWVLSGVKAAKLFLYWQRRIFLCIVDLFVFLYCISCTNSYCLEICVIFETNDWKSLTHYLEGYRLCITFKVLWSVRILLLTFIFFAFLRIVVLIFVCFSARTAFNIRNKKLTGHCTWCWSFKRAARARQDCWRVLSARQDCWRVLTWSFSIIAECLLRKHTFFQILVGTVPNNYQRFPFIFREISIVLGISHFFRIILPLPTSWHCYSTTEPVEEEVHVVFVMVHDQILALTQEESFFNPFRLNVVQPSKWEQSYLDFLGPSEHHIFSKSVMTWSSLKTLCCSMFNRMLERRTITARQGLTPTIPRW